MSVSRMCSSKSSGRGGCVVRRAMGALSLLRRTDHIRPMRAEDRELLVEFYARVSDQSKYYRFFSPMPELSEKDLTRFTRVDHRDRVALILLVAGQMIAVGRY